RYIFRCYAELGTVSALQADLKQRAIVSKVWTSTTGNVRGGVGYSRGALYYLLRNQIYLGRIANKNEFYDGQHMQSSTRPRGIRCRPVSPSTGLDRPECDRC